MALFGKEKAVLENAVMALAQEVKDLGYVNRQIYSELKNITSELSNIKAEMRKELDGGR